jgi:hypothetical protein
MKGYLLLFFFALLSISKGCMPPGKKNKVQCKLDLILSFFNILYYFVQVTIGDYTYVCIYLAPTNLSTTGEYLRLPIQAKADSLTKIRVPQCKFPKPN